ncbi:sensor histidine kinase [Romboutsia weinsteinii]|uniref:histidine kinase n=2 Tax=Romboutsia weinsteinii TaxID=2020949 RepID=A0A371J5W1_9FIRM|nr:sensor histidine kinase [Romboutsia weinsteinii]
MKKSFKDSYVLKYISLAILFLALSICFEAVFNLKYNFYNDFRTDFIPKYYFFGNVYEHKISDLFDDYIYLSLVSGLIALIFFLIYKVSKDAYSKLEKDIISFLSNFSVEVLIFIILFFVFIRFNIWEGTLPFYDRELMFCNFYILCLSYLSFKSFKVNKTSLLCNLFSDLLDKHTNSTLNKKLISTFIILLLLNILFIYIFFKPAITYINGGAINAMLFTFITLIIYSYIYHIVSKKFKYIENISKNIQNITEGNLNYKLEIKGNDEISSLARSINNITNGLEAALQNQIKSEKMKTELITNVSHDLKTPLTSIVNYVDIIKNNDLDESTMKDYINILDRKSQRLKTLIEDIFEASKLSSGDIEINLKKTDVKELLIQSIVELEDKIGQSNLDFNINVPDESIFTLIDGNKTWRVFENLIGNIIKYSMSNTRVYIDMFTDKNTVFITFKNISNHKLNIKADELLERFRRGDVSRSTDGSGLGLSIANSISELQDSSMSIDIDGDLFKVTLKFNQIN